LHSPVRAVLSLHDKLSHSFFYSIPLFFSSYKGISVHIPLGYKAAATAAATTSATATATAAAAATTTTTASRPEIEVIQPGLALFLGTGIFQEGASDWQRISSAAREVARNIVVFKTPRTCPG
jgi:hypothetical protein